jgi:hypothetical protein
MNGTVASAARRLEEAGYDGALTPDGGRTRSSSSRCPLGAWALIADEAQYLQLASIIDLHSRRCVLAKYRRRPDGCPPLVK